jgi:hypothetical protein
LVPMKPAAPVTSILRIVDHAFVHRAPEPVEW